MMFSTRDYDALRTTRPASYPPRLMRQGERDAITLQLWQWHDDGTRYHMTNVIIHTTDIGDDVAEKSWAGKSQSIDMYAWRRENFDTAMLVAGFVDVQWMMSGYFQPVACAWKK